MQRRHALTGLASAWLAGCGFRLREPPTLPFSRLALVGFEPRSPLAADLRRRLDGLVTVVPTPAEAEVVLHALTDRRQRTAATSTAAGQVREIELKLTLVARADTPGGRVLIAPFTLSSAKDMSYNEAAALAKAQEEEAMFRDMQADVIGQLLRRLAAIAL